MAEKNNRKCISCGQEYRYCSHCKEYASLPSWYALFHNENCKELFDTTSELTQNEITEEVARERFSACDLSYVDKLHKNIQAAIEKVNAGEKKSFRKKAKIDE